MGVVRILTKRVRGGKTVNRYRVQVLIPHILKDSSTIKMPTLFLPDDNSGHRVLW